MRYSIVEMPKATVIKRNTRPRQIVLDISARLLNVGAAEHKRHRQEHRR